MDGAHETSPPPLVQMMELAFGMKFGAGPEDDTRAGGGEAGGHGDHEHDAEGRCQKPSGASQARPEPPAPPPPPEAPEDEEARNLKRRRAEAVKEKEAGNDAYRAKNFEVAIGHYNKAMELDDTDISFLTNRYECHTCLNPAVHPHGIMA